jgi:indolepyruvate ferredoxin oxidoreductase
MSANDLISGGALRVVSLNDKFEATTGAVLLTGTQALVRLPMEQKRRDLAQQLNTAGYISGYRGSPLGGFDGQLHAARQQLQAHDIVFQPGVNEDLAATAVWGSQQAQAQGEGRFDGVFALWYGKGPGVDRSGDAFRHGNLAGSARHGGVLVLMGDDHTCESSTTCHQSEFALVDAMMPILSPAGVSELLSFGLLGWAMSRTSGCWVGLKCVKDTAEATAVVELDNLPVPIDPPDLQLPPDGVNLRQPDTPQAQELRLHNHKLLAAQAFARANGIDQVVHDAPGAWFGIATHGKSHLDLLQALHELGLSDVQLTQLGIRIFKVGMVWPLEPQAALGFAHGLEQLLVVEEKRSLVEAQLRELLYGRTDSPLLEGKKDAQGRKLFQAEMALDPVQIAVAIGERILLRHQPEGLAHRVEVLKTSRQPGGSADLLNRSFYFCSGCPHNTSTVVPEGSRAYAGIGCSWMAQTMERSTLGYTQMGAEGLSWVGEAPFSRRGHVFQNMGDGTFFHSGSLALRAAVAARTNITFKILFNDAVAMTGGQRHDGDLTPQSITWVAFAEGVARTVVVTDEPRKYAGAQAGPVSRARLAPGVSVHHRDELDTVQRMLREVPGTTVLVYDQTCAAEKRRRRKRGALEDPPRRVYINELVCEGCGDCGVQSNCVSLVPLETEFGRKRTIDQSSCNKDFSCLKGFCPSFVTVKGGRLKKVQATRPSGLDWGPLPEPEQPSLDEGSYSVLLTGIGGTGVVTLGAILTMAAHLERKGSAALDMAGLAQKGGSVWSHLRFSASQHQIRSVRIAPAGADLVLGGDLMITAGAKTRHMMRQGHTRVLVNLEQTMPGEFTRQRDLRFQGAGMLRSIEATVGADRVLPVDATRIATGLVGDAMATNLFMVGFASQRGLLPLGTAAIERAIEMNGASVAPNLEAYAWGRRAAVDLVRVLAQLPASAIRHEPAVELRDIVARRSEFLAKYQNAALAHRFEALVEKVSSAESALGGTRLAEAVARQYFRLLAYKDEYEVARLHVQGDFLSSLLGQYEVGSRLEFNLAPPLLSRRDPSTGRPRKIAFGGWIVPLLRALAAGKVLRGTAFDVFGYTAERRMERSLISRYEASVATILGHLSGDKQEAAIQLAALPQEIRGFGPVKLASLAAVDARWRELDAAVEGVR